ncbi:MAG: NAD(FAD)-utilizing dehydrogenases [uncultured Paraburkholderia sp.]|nr:MAG: NAD(FAD)-utilizing dehydrogenases [uncultured Paraburkholderia sp.]CAH2917549.1 MAG: NAD(FAD)-utilizing dehydrogenases [uncultured Paraburkholderia sp.]
MAGKGGMNITHPEPLEPFLDRYGARRDRIAPLAWTRSGRTRCARGCASWAWKRSSAARDAFFRPT